MGRQLREEIEKKIELVLAPPPSKKTKALPVPDEGYKKKRGGKRVRRQKESMAVTELRKAQNKMAFGVAEEEFGMSSGSSVGLGMVGQQSGKLRAIAADNRVKGRMKGEIRFLSHSLSSMPIPHYFFLLVNVAKKHHKFLSGSSSSTSGLSTSLAFTPVQGLELENPEAAQQRIKDLNTNYFSGGFERKE